MWSRKEIIPDSHIRLHVSCDSWRAASKKHDHVTRWKVQLTDWQRVKLWRQLIYGEFSFWLSDNFIRTGKEFHIPFCRYGKLLRSQTKFHVYISRTTLTIYIYIYIYIYMLWNGNELEKTKVMRISRQPFLVKVMTDQKQLKNVDCFKYLGSMLTNDGRCTCEIKSRNAMAKAAFNKKRALFTSTLDLELRKKLVKCYIWSTALHSAETWTLRAAN